jgi:hypothetical protein
MVPNEPRTEQLRGSGLLHREPDFADRHATGNVDQELRREENTAAPPQRRKPGQARHAIYGVRRH